MSPKEKAEELFQKMKGFRVKNSHSKKCALIAVEEIINSHYKLLGGVNTSIYNYWEEVKQELEKL